MVYKDLLWSCAGFPGFCHFGGELSRPSSTPAVTSLFCATPREMDPEFRAQQERLRALRAEPVPAIIIAARDGDVDALRRELDLGGSVDLADAWKSTPLQVACTYGKSRPRAAG